MTGRIRFDFGISMAADAVPKRASTLVTPKTVLSAEGQIDEPMPRPALLRSPTGPTRPAGVDAIFPGSPFERRFRDIHTLSQQIQSRDAHYETVGQVLLGNPPEVLF